MFILNLQFWEGDKDHAMELARLIADLEPTPRNDCIFLFSARFDCAHDNATVDYVGRKFPVARYTTKRRGRGWPNGPNQMMADSYGHCVEMIRTHRGAGGMVLFMESDAVPLHRNWINMLRDEYLASGKQVVGCWLMSGDCGIEHINGNCIIDINFWKKNRGIMTPPPSGGWDARLASVILPQGYPSRLIYSDYYLGTDRNPWKGCEYLWEPKRFRDPNNPLFGQDLYPVWYHGPKDGLALSCVRERLLGPPKEQQHELATTESHT